MRMEHITPSRPNTYTGGTLNRAAHLREDDGWIAAALENQATRFIVFWQGKPLVEGAAQRAPRAKAVARPRADVMTTFLGLQEDLPVFTADLSALEDPAAAIDPGDGEFTDMRSLTGALPVNDATILATARAMLHWQSKTRFCSVCGAPTTPIRAGYVRDRTFSAHRSGRHHAGDERRQIAAWPVAQVSEGTEFLLHTRRLRRARRKPGRRGAKGSVRGSRHHRG
jgi:hypothetical protein